VINASLYKYTSISHTSTKLKSGGGTSEGHGFLHTKELFPHAKNHLQEAQLSLFFSKEVLTFTAVHIREKQSLLCSKKKYLHPIIITLQKWSLSPGSCY